MEASFILGSFLQSSSSLFLLDWSCNCDRSPSGYSLACMGHRHKHKRTVWPSPDIIIYSMKYVQ